MGQRLSARVREILEGTSRLPLDPSTKAHVQHMLARQGIERLAGRGCAVGHWVSLISSSEEAKMAGVLERSCQAVRGRGRRGGGAGAERLDDGLPRARSCRRANCRHGPGGRDFKAGDLFVPEVLIAARAMHAGMNVLRPLLADGEAPSAGQVLDRTVKGTCTTSARTWCA